MRCQFRAKSAVNTEPISGVTLFEDHAHFSSTTAIRRVQEHDLQRNPGTLLGIFLLRWDNIAAIRTKHRVLT